MTEIRNYTMNSVRNTGGHGVMRLVMEMDGEVVKRIDTHIGLLHRATEKLRREQTLQSQHWLHGSAGLRVHDVQ